MTVPANARILSAITKPIVEAAKPAPKTELEWTQLDPSTLSPELRKAYDAYRDAARHAAKTLARVLADASSNPTTETTLTFFNSPNLTPNG